MTASNGKKGGDYNPIQGDILSFLNEVTKQHQFGAAVSAEKKQATEIAEKKEEHAPAKVIKSSGGKGLNMKSDEAFPALGEGIAVPAPTWGHGAAAPIHHQPTASSTVSQTFELPFEQQRTLRAEGRDKAPKTIAQICQEIAGRTRTSIDASTSSKTRAISFIIRGRQADVAEAKRQLWGEIAQSMTSNVEVPEEYLGSIIGAAGRTVQAIMAETGTKINIPKKSADGEATGYQGFILISGDAAAIELARARILGIVDEKAKKVVERVECQAHLLPFIYGVPSNKVHEQSQVWSDRYTIRITQDIDHENDKAVVTFSGDRDEVRFALGEFTRLLDEQKRQVKSVSTSLPKPLHKFLVGAKGSILHDLEAETGCEISIPRSDSSSDQITVFGPQEKLFKGLSAVMEKTSSMASETVRMSTTVRAVFFERHRPKVIELQNGGEIYITSIPEGIQVNGFKAKVPAVVTEIEALVKPMLGWKFDTSLMVDPKYFGHIIGKKGQHLKDLESQYGAVVIVPHGESHAKQALLIGAPNEASIKAAKASLNETLTALSDYLSIEMRVESKYHRAMIGKGGANVQKYNEKYPSVAIFFEEDSAFIKGRTAEVNAVQALMKEDLDTFKHEAIMHAYTTFIDMTPEQAKHLVFKKSVPARWAIAIASEMDVKLEVESDGKRLNIQGLKKMAEEAREAILDRLSKLENQGSISVDLDHAMHAALIGKGGKNVKHLDKKYQVHLAFPDQTETENNTIIISGPKNNLAAAKAELVAFHQHLLDNANSEELWLPVSALPRLFGKGGLTIDGIRLDSGASIDIGQRDSGAEMVDDIECVKVTISGTLEAIAKAKKAILNIISAVEQELVETVELTPKQVEIVNGPANFAYFRLVETHGPAVNIQLQTRRKDEPLRILIRGPKDCVPLAHSEIISYLKDLEKYHTVSIEIPSRAHGEIIGTGGENIKRLGKELRVKIDLPRSGTTVSVSGLPSDVQAALIQLQTYVKEERKFPVASRQTRQALLDKVSPAHPSVRFIPTREGLILRGPAADLDAALSALTLAASKEEDLKEESETIQVPKHQHGLLIGPGGSTAKAIREASGGCHLELPPRDSDSTEVKLVGSPEALQKAKLEIERILQH